MNVCMVLDNYFPPDIRVEKEAKALIEAGYNVYLLSLGKEGLPSIELINGITVIRVQLPENILIMLRKFFWFNMPYYTSIMRKKLEQIIEKYNIDVIHAHDLSTVKFALPVAKKFGVPIIADLHENYPEAIRAWRNVGKTIKSRAIGFALSIVSPVWIWKKIEKSVLCRVDYIFTVVEEAKEHYVNDCNILPEKVSIIMNTEDLEIFNNIKIDKSITDKYAGNFVISYIGGFGYHRGVDTAIKAMSKIVDEIPHAKLLLVGKGSREFEEDMKVLCSMLKVENNVEFVGWVDFRLVPTYIYLSDVCLVPHHSSAHTNTTIPHKLFQYMAMKKPVVVTDCKPLKRIVEECKCGIVVPSGDHRRLAEAVVRLYRNRDLAETFGKNGRKCVELKYNWRNEAEKLISVYREVIKCKE